MGELIDGSGELRMRRKTSAERMPGGLCGHCAGRRAVFLGRRTARGDPPFDQLDIRLSHAGATPGQWRELCAVEGELSSQAADQPRLP